jgi:hypothetical protein
MNSAAKSPLAFSFKIDEVAAQHARPHLHSMSRTQPSESSKASHVPYLLWCDSNSPRTESSREQRSKRLLHQHSTLWTSTCLLCHLGTAYVTSQYNQETIHDSFQPSPTPQSSDDSTLNATRILLSHVVGNLVSISKRAPNDPMISRRKWLTDPQLRSLHDPEPVVFLCASVAWGITTAYLLRRYTHHPYQYHFLVAGISTSLLLGALSMTLGELPSYSAITYTPLGISFIMISSIMLHRLLLGNCSEGQ